MAQIGVAFGQRSQLWWDLALIESLNLIARICRVEPNQVSDHPDAALPHPHRRARSQHDGWDTQRLSPDQAIEIVQSHESCKTTGCYWRTIEVSE